MNQIHQHEAFKSEPTADPTKPALKPGEDQRVRLSAADARVLQSTLVQGNDALAQRKDLGEMHKRFIAAISTLDKGLAERQTTRSDEVQSLLTARLDGMERAINEIEGVLRIEMEPMLRTVMADAVKGELTHNGARRKTPFSTRLFQIALLGACIFLGSVFPTQIRGLTQNATSVISGIFTTGMAILSPDGGIRAEQNRVE